MTAISARRFLLAFSAVFAGLVALLAAHSAIVDPFGLWGTRLYPEVGYAKFGRETIGGDRIAKGLLLARGPYDLVIIGSSRSLYGFDGKARAFAGRRVFNAAMQGAVANESAAALDHALKSQPDLRDLIVGLDLFAFTRTQPAPDFARSVFAGASRIEGYASLVLGKEAIDRSLRFWRVLVRKREYGASPSGFQPPEPHWLRPPRRAQFVKQVGGGLSDCEAPGEAMRAIDRALAAYAAPLKRAKAKGVNLHLHISPVHVWSHAFEDAAKRTEINEHFKRRVAALAQDLREAPGAGSISLWDFDAIDSVTMDAPPPDDLGETRYFWEASHFRTSVGDAMLAAMLGAGTAIEGFGVRLDGVDIEAHLDATREKLARWIRAHPEDSAFLAAKAAKRRICRDGAFVGVE